MPYIRSPMVSAPKTCPTKAAIKLNASTANVTEICSDNGKILVRGSNAHEGFKMTDIVARSYGPLLRAEHAPGIKVLRVEAKRMGADPDLGLGLANISNGIGSAVFRHLIWYGDPDKPAINSDDAWAAIALKGKDANDTGEFVIENFDFQDLYMAKGSHYLNVDGISTEKGYSGSISGGRVIGASDACIDIKGDVRVDNVFLAQCREGLKTWASQNHGLIELGTNRFVGIIGKGYKAGTRNLTIDVLIASGDPSVPLFRAEGGVVNLTIGRLVAKAGQVIEAQGSYKGSTVTIKQRVYQ